MTDIKTARQGELEDVQACLGNALVYLKLIDLRIRMAAANQPDLLGPAVEDVASAFGLVKRAQAEVGSLGSLPARGQGG